MGSIKNNIGILSLIFTVLIVISIFLFIKLNLNFENTITTGSGDIIWITYLIKFYVIFSLIGLTANLILMHYKFIKMKGFHEW
jgi:hypothetical protein